MFSNNRNDYIKYLQDNISKISRLVHQQVKGSLDIEHILYRYSYKSNELSLFCNEYKNTNNINYLYESENIMKEIIAEFHVNFTFLSYDEFLIDRRKKIISNILDIN